MRFSIKKMELDQIDNKISNFFHNPIIFIGAIMVISLIIRLSFFPNFPLTLDSLDYFFYASDISVNQKIPINYTPANNGWPIFLSAFFTIFQFDNVISYMNLQRILSISISVLTVIPIFFLCKKFFDKNLSLLGAAIFAFEPRLIQNSLFGITDALYIFLISVTLVTFLGSKKIIYFSFIFASFATLVRSEGIMILIFISIMFFIKFRNEKSEFPKFILAMGIMILILMPVMIFKQEVSGSDIIFSRTITAVSVFDQYMKDGNEYGKNPLFTGIEYFSKYFLWNLIPIFIFFIPIGIFYLFKKIDFRKSFIIIGVISFSIPAFWAYSLPLQDSRYLFFIYPFLILISLFTLEKISNKKYSNLVLSLIIIGIIVSSLIFLEIKINNEHEREAYLIAKNNFSNIKVINSFTPESKFLEVVIYPEKWEDFKLLFKQEREKNISIRDSLQKIEFVDAQKFTSISELIEHSSPKLTHIIIDNTFGKNDFLYEIYENEEKFFFLKKIYDSKENEYSYKLKIFEIDYEKFSKLYPEKIS